MTLNNRRIEELKVCWNLVIHRIISYSKWESVKAILLGLGRLNVKRLIIIRNLKFYCHLCYSNNLFLSNIFSVFMLCCSNEDFCLKLYFSHRQKLLTVYRFHLNYMSILTFYSFCLLYFYYASLSFCPLWQINVLIQQHCSNPPFHL
jgi:hypothetical protein